MFQFFFSYLDIDECITGNHDCHVNATCTNTVGSHNCTCKEGYTGNGGSCAGTLIFDVYCISFFWQISMSVAMAAMFVT